MTVKELIKQLRKIKDQDTRVVISGYEGGYNDIEKIVEMSLHLDVNTEWYYGRHEFANSSGTPAILISN